MDGGGRDQRDVRPDGPPRRREAAVTTVDNAAERARRQVRRPSKAEAYRDVVVQALTDDGTLRSVELLHRARLAGYTGGTSAL